MRKSLFLFLMASMCFTLAACNNFNDSKNIPTPDSSTSELSNVSESTDKSASDESNESESFEELLKNELNDAFGNDTVINYNTLSYYAETDKYVISIAIFPDGAEDCYRAARKDKAGDEASTWEEFQTNIIDLDNTITEQAKKQCEITVCSDKNHHIKLITVFDGEIVYDWLED